MIKTLQLGQPIPLSGPYEEKEWVSCEFGPCYLNLDVHWGHGTITLTKEEGLKLAEEIKRHWKGEGHE